MSEALIFPRLIYKGEQDLLGSGLIGATKRVDSQHDLDAALKDGWRLTSHNPADDAQAKADATHAQADSAQGHRDAVKLAATMQARAQAEAAALQPVAQAEAANTAAKAEIAAHPAPKPDPAKVKADADALKANEAADAAAKKAAK
jgi:hypothetical protein